MTVDRECTKFGRVRIFSFMVVAALAACGSKKEEPPPAPGCEPAVDNAIKLSRDAIPDDKVAAKAREVSLTRCNEDKWSPETRECLVKAKVAADVAGCGTPAERKKLEEALAAAMMGSDPGPGSDVGSGSAGSGSGSAGSGSGSAGSGSAGSGSAGSGSAAKGSGAGSGSAMKTGSGSGSATPAAAGSGSAAKPAAGSGSATGSGSGSGSGSANK